MVTPLLANAADLEHELEWFATVLDARLKHYFDSKETSPLAATPPDLTESDSPLRPLRRSS